jgi:hypothetical protein
MSPLTALAAVNNATNIAFTLAASNIIARVSESSCLRNLLEQEAANRHRFSFWRRPLRGAAESNLRRRAQGVGIAAIGQPQSEAPPNRLTPPNRSTHKTNCR